MELWDIFWSVIPSWVDDDLASHSWWIRGAPVCASHGPKIFSILNFMQFLENLAKSYGEFWIRPWSKALYLKSNMIDVAMQNCRHITLIRLVSPIWLTLVARYLQIFRSCVWWLLAQDVEIGIHSCVQFEYLWDCCQFWLVGLFLRVATPTPCREICIRHGEKCGWAVFVLINLLIFLEKLRPVLINLYLQERLNSRYVSNAVWFWYKC